MQWQQNALQELQKICNPTFYTPSTQATCQQKGEEFKKMYAEQAQLYQKRVAASTERVKKLEQFAGEFKKHEDEGRKRSAASSGSFDDLGMPNDGLDIDEYGLRQYIGTSDEISSSSQFTSQYDPAFANPAQGLQSNYNGFMGQQQQQNMAYPVGQPNYFQQQQNPYARPMYQYQQPQPMMYQQQYPASPGYYPMAQSYQQPMMYQQQPMMYQQPYYGRGY